MFLIIFTLSLQKTFDMDPAHKAEMLKSAGKMHRNWRTNMSKIYIFDYLKNGVNGVNSSHQGYLKTSDAKGRRCRVTESLMSTIITALEADTYVSRR